MMQPEDRVAGGGWGGTHVALNEIVNVIVRRVLQCTRCDPDAWRGRPPAREREEISGVNYVVNLLLANIVSCLVVRADLTGGVIQWIVIAPECLRKCPVFGPVPIRQRERRVPGRIAQDLLKIMQIGSVPRQEPPVCVGTAVL